MSKSIIEMNGYKYWRHVDVVKNYIWDFLEESFPESIISPELFYADFFVLIENLPVEIQSTIILTHHKKTGDTYHLAHSQFESVIQKQIQENVNFYGKCWFFFDSAYFNYLSSDLGTRCRINMDWFYQLVKSNKIKVFTISYDGVITSLSSKDFGFLLNTSMTCKIGMSNDRRVLDINKFAIMNALLKNYAFATDEINQFYNDFKLSDSKEFLIWSRSPKSSQRAKLYGNLLHSIGNLQFINDILDITCKKDIKLTRSNKNDLVIIGLFAVEGKARGAKTYFADKFNIAQYFPGYLRNKEKWDIIRNTSVTFSTLNEILKGDIDIAKIEKHPNEVKVAKKEKIRQIVLEANNYTEEELNEYRYRFENDNNSIGIFNNWLMKPNRTEREKLLGKILIDSIKVNSLALFFNRSNQIRNHAPSKTALVTLGIIDTVRAGKNTTSTYVDKHNIAQLFDEYLVNKEFWDSLKNRKMNYYAFWDFICTKDMKQVSFEYFD